MAGFFERLLSKPMEFIASVITKTRWLSSVPKELCDNLNFLLQKIDPPNISNECNGKILDIVDKLLDYKCLSEKQHRFLKNNCSN